jgi:hypothetical protein
MKKPALTRQVLSALFPVVVELPEPEGHVAQPTAPGAAL